MRASAVILCHEAAVEMHVFTARRGTAQLNLAGRTVQVIAELLEHGSTATTKSDEVRIVRWSELKISEPEISQAQKNRWMFTTDSLGSDFTILPYFFFQISLTNLEVCFHSIWSYYCLCFLTR